MFSGGIVAAYSRALFVRSGVIVTAVAVTVASLSACTGSGSAHKPNGSSASSSTPGGSTPGGSTPGGSAPASSPTLGTPVTTTVPPPVPGNVSQIVPSKPVHTLAKVPLSQTVTVAAGVVISISEIKAVNAVSHVPGDVNGPAVQITVAIKNTSSKALNVNSAEVDVSDSKGDPGIPVTTSESRIFSGSVAPGAEATGVYVFRVAADRRDPITVTASYTGAGPVAQFAGAVK